VLIAVSEYLESSEITKATLLPNLIFSRYLNQCPRRIFDRH